MKKGGQFYLIAVVFIVAMLIGFFTVTNFSQKKYNPDLEPIKQELNYEVQKIIEYGIYNNKSTTEINEMILDFTEHYTENSNKDFYFIFGEKSNLTVSSYQSSEDREIIIRDDSGDSTLTISKNSYSFKEDIPLTDTITIITNDWEKDFVMREGINFYFIISYEQDNQRNIIIQK